MLNVVKKQVGIFITSDGKEYFNQAEAIEHEFDFKVKEIFEKYRDYDDLDYSKALKKHSHEIIKLITDYNDGILV